MRPPKTDIAKAMENQLSSLGYEKGRTLAKRLGIAESTLGTWVQRKRVRSEKLNGEMWVNTTDVSAMQVGFAARREAAEKFRAAQRPLQMDDPPLRFEDVKRAVREVLEEIGLVDREDNK